MAPKKKTGVQNVNIGGAYKLEREGSEQAAHEVADQAEAVDAELEEDVDAELEALAQAEEESDPEITADAETKDIAESAQETAAVTDNQEHVGGNEDDEEEDVDVELQRLAEEIGKECAKNAEPLPEDLNEAHQAADSKDHGDAPEAAAQDLPHDDADMTDAEDEAPVTEGDDSGGDAAGANRAAVTSALQDQAVNAKSLTGDAAGATSPLQAPAMSTPGVSGSTSDAPAAGTANKSGATANKPVFKSKKRQLAPVAAAAAPAVTPQAAPGPAAAAAKPTAGSTAGAVIKAVAPAANKAAGKLKGTASQSKENAKPSNAAASGTTAKPPTAGKKLTALLAKPTSTDAPSTAATPIKTPAKAPAKKAVPAGNTEGPIAQGPTAKGKGKGKDGDAEKAPKAPRAKNAYMFFMADKRDAVKSETPGISVADIAKAIGEMWRGLSDDDKKPYQDLADGDKARVAKVKADMPPVPKQAKPAKEAKADKAPRAKSAYMLFCDAKRGEIKAANSEAGFGETGKLLAAAWKDCTPEDKAKYQEQSQAAKMELQSVAAAATQTAVAIKKKQKPTQPAKPAVKPAAKPAVSAESHEAEGQEDEEEAEEGVAAEIETESGGLATLSEAADAAADTGDLAVPDAATEAGDHAANDLSVVAPAAAQDGQDEESDDEGDRENADWEANPAECIIGHTYHNKYMVKRKGLDFTEYGLVDARAAKRQRLTGDNNDPKVPVSLEMVEEYDTFCKDFRRCVHENQDQGNLDLDNIGQGSALEMCYYLGKLQEEHYLLSKPPKRKGEVDVMIKVPMLGVSMVTQRLVNVERRLRMEAEALAAEKAEEAERLKGELTVLQMMATAAQGKQTAVMEE